MPKILLSLDRPARQNSRPTSRRRRTPRALLALVLLSAFFLSALAAGAEAPRFADIDKGPVSLETEQLTQATELWRSLANAHDFDVVFSPKLRDLELEIRVKNATLGETFDRLALAGAHFWKPLDERTILVASDTPQARRTYEPQAVETVRLENIHVKDAMTVLRSIYGLKHLTADEERQTLTLRDLAGKVALARDHLSRIDVPVDEVAVGLELIRVPEKLWQARESGADLSSAGAESVLRTDLGIVGRRNARFDLEERLGTSGDRFALGVELEAQVHPESREVTLALNSRLAKVESASGELAESKKTASSWRIPSGTTHYVELPGRLEGQDGTVLALALTPEIVRAATPAPRGTQWIHAEATGGSPEAPDEISDELKERLRAKIDEKKRRKATTEN